jgi:Oxidoreductase molybdopterin binding domain
MFCCGPAVAAAQQMEHSAPNPSTHLTIKTYEGKTLTLSPEELAALPHKSVSVFNAHSKANETYSGVPLADLLSKVGVPLGESVRGKLFLTGVVASGVDGYGVLYSLAEVDPSIHTGDVIVADTLDGKKLDKDGAFKMVSSEERRPARWVRNLATISVVKVEP